MSAAQSPPAGEIQGLVERLRHAHATASNDDESAPLTEKRRRHVERLCVIEEAAEAITRLSQPSEKAKP